MWIGPANRSYSAAPGAPTGVTATAGNGSATVSFTPPANNGSSAITGYTVTASPGGSIATGASSPINVAGLATGTAYTFTVTATNSVGTGPSSAPSNSVTPTGGSSFVIYSNGTENALYNANLSFGNAVDLNNTARVKSPHTQSLKIPSGGAWQYGSTQYFGQSSQSYIGPYGLDISPYTYFGFYLNTDHPSDQFDCAAHYDGAVQLGGADVATPAYVPNLPALGGVTLNTGAFTFVKVPLAALGLLGIVDHYKFFLRDNSGNDSWWDDLTLIPGSFSWIHNGGQARSWNSGTSSYNQDASTPLNGWSDASVNASVNYSFSPLTLSTTGNTGSVGAGVTGLTNPGSSTTPCNVAKITVSATGGLWKLTHAGFPWGAYDHLTFSLLPTQAGYSYLVQFYNTSGAAVGNAVNPASYTAYDGGPGSAYFTVYIIPMSAFGSLPANLGGISIKDNSGLSSNTFYGSGLGFYS